MKKDTNKWNSFDTRWMLSLFGTAVGAGILFLPIRAGSGGFWPVVVMTIIIFPMVWLSHRALSRFVFEAKRDDQDITHAAEEYWGRGISLFITFLYFFAIYPICLAYGVGITNIFGNFIMYQLDITSLFQTLQDDDGNLKKVLNPSVRIILTFILVSAMMLVMLLKEEWITKACNALVYPLCIVLFAFSIYLIPYWKIEVVQNIPNIKDFLVIVWLTLPVLVFAFNHSPAISTFSMSVKRKYGEKVNQKSNQILFRTSIMLLIFIMFFTFSCILSLNQSDFDAARKANIPILSYFANTFVNDGNISIKYYIFSYAAPIVAFLAIVSSFFGHYFGAYEGLCGIVRKTAKLMGNENPNTKAIKIFSTLFMYITIIAVGYMDPSILGFIEDLGGPIIAMILFVMPIFGFYTVAKLKKYKNKNLDIFIIITGIFTIISVLYKFIA